MGESLFFISFRKNFSVQELERETLYRPVVFTEEFNPLWISNLNNSFLNSIPHKLCNVAESKLVHDIGPVDLDHFN